MSERTTGAVVESVDAAMVEALIDDLAALLRDCVYAGASVGFVAPFSVDEAAAFWRASVLPTVARGERAMWVATVDGRLAGTVQLILATPPNQPHRGEVTKLLVHPAHRRKGLARALMAALDARAATEGKTLITLDTRTGDNAEPLYASLGYEVVGQIPDFCVDPLENKLDPTTVMFKRLAGAIPM